MPHSAMESVRQRLEAMRRRQNLGLALASVGRWLLGSSLLFLLLVAAGNLLALEKSGWQILFLLWAAGVFLLSFYFIWRLLEHWQSRESFVHLLEQRLPELEQRLITSVEFDGRDQPGVSRQFVELLKQDAGLRMEMPVLRSSLSLGAAWRSLAAGAVAVCAVVSLVLFSETFLQGGRQLAWPWDGQGGAPSLPVALRVEPGSLSMQRGDDLTITAFLDNARSDQLQLYVQADRLNWRQLSMGPESGQPADGAKVFAIDLPQLSEDLAYYVEYRSADGVLRSPQYQVSLFDLPRVEGLQVAYDFPDYTAMGDKVDKPGGDIVAPVGTRITLTADLNKQVKQAVLVFEDDQRLPLQLDGRRASGSFEVSSDTNYRIELLDRNDYGNRNPVDYYVRAIPDREPELSLRAPGKDQRVMPLEEVPVVVQARDDYGLTRFELVYSLVGGEPKTVDFLPAGEDGLPKSLAGETLVYLEDLQVQPGDVISYSVTATDNNGINGPRQVVSDIYFLEVIPTDHEFSRGRSGGGGGGGGAGGGDASALVSTQKEVIAATWKLRNRQDSADPASVQADGQIIRESQAEVAQRAQMSINRLTERGTFAEDNYQKAVEALQRAIREMEAAVQKIDELSLAEALQSEQRALQAVLQAEAQVNRTQVAMSRGGGGGGGGQNSEREDLRELFEMEMGELENRYELPQQQAGQPRQAQNETLDKLKELARRQERLTRSQRELAQRENQLDEEQKRRQLEQLRREQEELSRQLNELSRSLSASSQQSPQQSCQSDSRSQASRSSGSGGSQDSRQQQQQQQQARQQQLQQALEQMQQAAESESASQAAAKSQKALDSLRKQAQQMDADGKRSLADLQQAVREGSEQLLRDQRELRRMVEEKGRSESLSNTRSETARSGVTEDLQRQQDKLREGMENLRRDLRDIASLAGEDQQREMQEAHDIARALRPVEEKMATSRQILQRGMLNLSLKIESDIENELSKLQRRIAAMGNGPGGPQGDQEAQVAEQVRQLRQSLEELQQQVEQAAQPEELARRQGERSGAAEANQGSESSQSTGNGDMRRNLERSRELAEGLARLGIGGQPWSATARSIRSQLTEQKLEEFLSRPQLVQQLLEPVIELQNRLRVQSELNAIDSKLYSAIEEDVPEAYRALVQDYYRALSDSESSASERSERENSGSDRPASKGRPALER